MTHHPNCRSLFTPPLKCNCIPSPAAAIEELQQRCEKLEGELDRRDEQDAAAMDRMVKELQAQIKDRKRLHQRCDALLAAVKHMPEVAYKWIFVDHDDINNLPNELQCIADAAESEISEISE
jgi:hypothetical protein